MVCSRSALPLAIESLRQFHPYEEPAIDVYELVAQPDRRIGAGRRLHLDQPATLADLAERLKKHLNISAVNIADPDNNPKRLITTLGVVPGSGASLIPAALRVGCELFVTGEAKHHEMMDALASNVSLLLAGHTNTERGYLPRLAAKLREQLPRASVLIAASDASPRIPV
jgi:putative NIF3 family GTP cyclohydrolase 1 type 2